MNVNNQVNASTNYPNEPKVLDNKQKQQNQVSSSTESVHSQSTSLSEPSDKLRQSVGQSSTSKPLTPDMLDSIQDIFEKFNPTRLVEDLRSASGGDRDKLLLNFKGEIDKMSEKELRTLRDHLGQQMAAPDNTDDPFLGLLLNAVNAELDSRSLNISRPRPFPTPMPSPMPPTWEPKPWPQPGRIDSPFPPNHMPDMVHMPKPIYDQLSDEEKGQIFGK